MRQVKHIRPQVSQEQYQKIREDLICNGLKTHIEKRLLVERTRSELKPDQVKALEKHLNETFDSQQVENMKKQFNVVTRTELEQELNSHGTTLSDLRNTFITQGIAQGYLQHRLEQPKPVTRLEMVNYYREHEKDYFVPAKVRWQQVQVTYANAGGRTAAEDKLRQAREELDGGMPFADVVAKYSDGPKKKDQGLWDWINHGSLADEELEDLLFTMPVKTATESHFGRTACQLRASGGTHGSRYEAVR